MNILALALLVSVSLGADKKGKDKPKPHAAVVARENGCPFVATADITKSGDVQNVVGNELPHSGEIWSFDSEGPVAKLRVAGSGDLKMSNGVPAKVKSSAFTHVLATDVKDVHVAQPDKDLPQGVFPDAVQIFLADHAGGKVALLTIPGSGGDDDCSEIQAKVKGSWKRCWTDCRGQ